MAKHNKRATQANRAESLSGALCLAGLLIYFHVIEAHLVVLCAALCTILAAYAKEVDLGRRFWRWMRDRL